MKLNEISDGRGSQVLAFNDYLAKLVNARYGVRLKEDADTYKQIGIGLFKEGFTFDAAKVEFYKLPEEGGVYEITFPHLVKSAAGDWGFDASNSGFLKCVYYNGSVQSSVRFDKTISLHEIKLYTVPTLLKFMQEAARPRST